jgi:hypothetical protein
MRHDFSSKSTAPTWDISKAKIILLPMRCRLEIANETWKLISTKKDHYTATHKRIYPDAYFILLKSRQKSV